MNNLVRCFTGTNNIINLSICSKRYAGHSKWANIKHDKAIKDGKRALNFNKLRRLIEIAVTEGNNVNPALNHRLALVIDQAKRVMMPMSTINKVLASCQSDKTRTISGIYEIRGPGRSIILAEYACENLVRLKMDMNTILRKSSCAFADHGAQHMFDYKGVVTTEVQGDIESATEHAIQANAEDVQEFEHGDIKEFHFICDPNSLFNVRQNLEQLKYTVKTADKIYIPHQRVNLDDAQLNSVLSLVNRLEAMEEILKLHDNIE